MPETHPETPNPVAEAPSDPVLAKRSPRRKVGTRPKPPTAADANGAAAPARRRTARQPAASAAEGNPGELLPAPESWPPQQPSLAVEPEPERPPTPAPAIPATRPFREPILSTEEIDPQARIETQVISREVSAALERKTAEVFGHAAAPAESAPAPTAPAPEAVAPLMEPQVSRPVAHQQPAQSSTPAPQNPPQQPQQQSSRFPQQGRRHFEGRERDRDRHRDGGGQQHPRNGGGGGGGGNFGGRPQPSHQQPRPPRYQGAEDGQAQGEGNNGPAESLVSRQTEQQFAEGIVEVSGKGFGFLRESKRNYVQTPNDIFVTPEVCRRFDLRDGIHIKGEIRRSSRGPQLFRLVTLNGEDPEKFRNLPNFDELTTINPRVRMKLETEPTRYTTRVMDLMTPIGKGQRGLIVAPPRTGKTTLLQHIGEAVVKNHPDMHLIILLVDERPEEVTEIRRAVPQAEIMASSNDNDLKSHTRIAILAMERAKRLVEAGKHVFLLLDSITRMGRAFNNSLGGGGGATMSGGVGARALEIPRKIFAAARNTEEAGSLTIIATALIETGSRMDDVIFQEFKGTGNMELVLDRKISDLRLYPAVDIFQSGTRREELLLQEWELDKINVIRRGLAGHKPVEAIERLLSFLKKFPTNAQMLASLPG